MDKYLTRYERVLVAKHTCEMQGKVFVPSNAYEEQVVRTAKQNGDDTKQNWRALVFAITRS